MSCCAKNILKRCQPVNVCGNVPVVLPYDTLMDGVYTCQLEYLGSQVIIQMTAQGGKVSMPVNGLNENYYYEGRLFNSEGVLQLIDDEHDAFAFQTMYIMGVGGTPAPVIPEVEQDPVYEADKPFIVVSNYNEW